MPFPITPFEFGRGKEGDAELLKYLKNPVNFPYLEDTTKVSIKNELTESSLNANHTALVRLWSKILTDVILELKRNDSREWNEKNTKVDFESFFDKNSLGINELEEVFLGFTQFEGIMYGASPESYRDHITHPFRVWIIGQGMLDTYFDNKIVPDDNYDYLKSDIEEEKKAAKVELQISKNEWSCMWTIIALCHDVGYPLSQIDKINQKAQKTLKQQGLKSSSNMTFAFSDQILPFHNTIIKLMSSKPIGGKNNSGNIGYFTHLQNKYYLKLLKSFDNLDHGIISSLLVSNSLLYFLESDLSHDNYSPLSEKDCRQFLIRREILRAIAAHTCQDIYHVKFNTLSFLLYIIDEIQCWGRPTLQEMQHEISNLKEGCVKVSAFSDEKIDITITTLAKQWSKSDLLQISKQVGKLRKMLRLALDIEKVEKYELNFMITNERGDSCVLSLSNGKLQFNEEIKAE